MKKISQINIKNYRAFYNEKEPDNNEIKKTYPYLIDLPAGQNLLVYGENGSGKSSFFHALADFFASASNQDLKIEENIFTEGNAELPSAQIEVYFSEKSGETWNQIATPFLFSANSTTYQDSLLVETSQAFLTYRDMLKTYFLAIDDKENNPNLFDLFIDKLLSKVTETAQNDEIKAKLADIENQAKQLPKAIQDAIEERENEGEAMEEEDKKDLREAIEAPIQEKISSFNESLTLILEDAIQEVNAYLSDYFKVNFSIFLQNRDAYLTLENEQLSRTLYFDIEYFGKKLEGKAYQIFLNEARLSALAICLYLVAVKKDRPNERNYKILFLDDIFIGLDTSNRLPLLKISAEYFSDYQIFMTTYDRHWFEVARDYLGKNWKAIEMYVGDGEITENGLTKTFDKPIILQDNLEPLDKAKLYFEAHDYFSAGNNLRKAIEKRLEKLLPETYRISIRDTNDLIMKLFIYFEDMNCLDLIPAQLKESLMLFKDIVFNPSSHYDLRSPLYKAEIEKAFDIVKILEDLPIIERKRLLGIRACLFYKNVSHNYEATYELLEDLYVVIIQNQNFRISDAKHHLHSYIQDGTPHTGTSTEIRLSKRPEKIKKHLKLSVLPDWQQEFTDINGKSLSILAQELL